ncbi:Long chain base biosynthesis protein 1 [Zea mays]|uniref:Long chain base biosynthesis protein 1 n=1 Tax=Zea mays TaxID=4577 RepID=A0A1D6F6C2_MAIZE|nr:Long chain base biosynthesis protein 1 [Zea mays]
MFIRWVGIFSVSHAVATGFFRSLGRGRASYCSHSVPALQEELQTTKEATH